MLLLLLALSQAFASTAAQDAACYECATPTLQRKWYTTGLPNRPSSLGYTDKCFSPDVAPTVACSSKCFELTFPLDGAQQIVRGCWRNFIVGYDDLLTVGNRCEYSISVASNATSIALGSTGEKTTNPISVMRTCQSTVNNDPCNGRFFLTANSIDGSPFTGNATAINAQCTKGNEASAIEAPSGKTCLSCAQLGDDGKCKQNTKTTCNSGAYCLKMHGKLGKNDVDIRGCAQINPFGDEATGARDVCFNMDGDFDLDSMFGVGPTYSFDKKSYMCICKNDRCNAAASLGLLLSLLLTAATSYSFLG